MGCASLAGRILGLEGVARETRDAAHLCMYKVQLGAERGIILHSSVTLVIVRHRVQGLYTRFRDSKARGCSDSSAPRALLRAFGEVSN